MLAYVFWHWKQDRIEVNRYEMLLQFHTSLTQKQPEGFIHSIAFAIEGAPWATVCRSQRQCPCIDQRYDAELCAVLRPK